MIGKSLALLCVVFGITAGAFVQVPQCGTVVSTQLLTSPVVQISGNNLCGNNVFAGNVVGDIASDGPETAPLPVIQAPPVTLPTVHSPIVALPSQPIPAPRVISQRCICTKTIVKPQVIQRQVTVPKVQRYIKRTVTPIVENVTYKSKPISSCRSAVVGTSAAFTQGTSYSRLY